MHNKFTHSIIVLTTCLVVIFSVFLSIKISLKIKDKKINPLIYLPNKLSIFNGNH